MNRRAFITNGAAAAWPLAVRRSKADMRRCPASIASVANDAVDGASSAASKCYRLVASKPSDLRR